LSPAVAAAPSDEKHDEQESKKQSGPPEVYEALVVRHNAAATITERNPTRFRIFLANTMLHLITYPHPTLRYPSKPIARVDAQLKGLIEEMFEIMYEHRGVGLAANQVNLPLRLFVANPSGEKETGPELVFINPVIQRATGTAEAEEGCLSLPGLNAFVKRNKSVRVNAYGIDGKEIDMEVEGFLARIIQHELDHLDGVLFIDRISDENKSPLLDDLSGFESTFEMRRRTGLIGPEEQLDQDRKQWEAKYC
jgi:peptide deformylase